MLRILMKSGLRRGTLLLYFPSPGPIGGNTGASNNPNQVIHGFWYPDGPSGKFSESKVMLTGSGCPYPLAEDYNSSPGWKNSQEVWAISLP